MTQVGRAAHLAAIADADDQDEHARVEHLVQDSMIAYADPEDSEHAPEFRHARRQWIVRETGDGRANDDLGRTGERRQFPPS